MTEKKIIKAATLVSFPLDHMNRVYDTKGCAPTIATRSGGCNEPKILVHQESVKKEDRMDIEEITIRKLTEREALRLQGFTEEADKIVDAKDENGRRMFPMTTCYVFAGNAVCVNAF